MTEWTEPNADNAFLQQHAILLLQSFRHFIGRDLIDGALPPEVQAKQLFEAPFVVVSHNTADEPIFNYGNRAALQLFEMTWAEFTCLPSRLSAEPVHQQERQRLMEEVVRKGYIADFRGVRIAKSGRRFWIENTFVWNLLDTQSRLYGQAAMFGHWRYLES